MQSNIFAAPMIHSRITQQRLLTIHAQPAVSLYAYAP